jgi:uncharacterized iron-regulated membrane protein
MMSSTGVPARGELPEQEADATPRSSLYRAVWRWHFYAGLFSIPVIVMLALSGIVYLFRPQIEHYLYDDMAHVTPGTQATSFQTQMDNVKERYPDRPVVAVDPPGGPNRATQFHVDNGAKDGAGFAPAGETVYVDPYNGEIKGVRNNAYNPAQIALQLHGFLMTTNFLGDQKWGDHFLELVASWTVVLVVTGIYLWWPRGRSGRSLRGVLIPRLNLKTRVRWRDVHAITGVLFSFVFLFFLATGLMWTNVWGHKYSEVATRFNATYPAVPTDSSPPQTIADAVGEGKTTWATSALPVIPSGKPAGASASGAGLTWDPAKGAPLDAVIAQAQQLGFTSGYTIFMPQGETGSYMATRGPDNNSKPNQSDLDERTAFIDQYTAQPVGAYGFSQLGIMAKATDFGISLHEGREWGLPSQILALIGTLAILVSCATSVVMWFKRRPRGVGAPRRVYTRSATVGLVVITLSLGVFFPLLGMSLVALFIFDFVIARRIPPLARAFGMS